MVKVDFEYIGFILSVIGGFVLIVIPFVISDIDDDIVFGFVYTIPLSALFFVQGFLFRTIHLQAKRIRALEERNQQ